MQHGDSKITGGQRAANGKVALRVPQDVIKALCPLSLPRQAVAQIGHAEPRRLRHRQGLWGRIPGHRPVLPACQRRLAPQPITLRHAETSMLKTLAAKHQSTVTKMAARHRAKIETPLGLRKCFEARVERHGKRPLVARFGGIPLVRDKSAALTDHQPRPLTYPRKELTVRLLRRRCEMWGPGQGGSAPGPETASLANRTASPPAWAALMIQKRRKTFVVCQPCHDAIHCGHPNANTA